MKSHIILLFIGLNLVIPQIYSQDWIGSQFALDTSIVLQSAETDLTLSSLTYCINDGIFYYADIKAFQGGNPHKDAVIHAVSLYDYAQHDFILPSPPSEGKRDWKGTQFWLNDFDFNGEHAAVSTQNQIVIYKKTDNFQYVYDTIYEHPFIKATYIHQDQLYYLEEDHDAGYKWFRRPLHGGEEVLIRELPYEAPHVVQAQPNRYLFRNQNYVFFLSTRYPVLHQYSLDGQWVGDIEFDLPTWHPFEDDYIAKTLSVPYGVERIYLTMADIFKYSYPKVVFPLYDNYLLYYAQYDTIAQRSHLQYAIYDQKSGETTLWSKKDTSSEAYTGERFPFNLFQPQTDKAHLSWGNLLLEISADDTLSWLNRTPSEYEQAREAFFKQNDPVYKLRIMRYKNTDWAAEPFFIDTDSRLHPLEDLPYGKSLLLVTHELECTACERQLLQLLNHSSQEIKHIGITHPYIPGALLERELQKRVKLHLEKPFGLYYLAVNRYAQYPWDLSDNISYPALLFYETGKAPFLFSLDKIFDDNLYSPNYRDEFLDFWQKFNSSEVANPSQD